MRLNLCLSYAKQTMAAMAPRKAASVIVTPMMRRHLSAGEKRDHNCPEYRIDRKLCALRSHLNPIVAHFAYQTSSIGFQPGSSISSEKPFSNAKSSPSLLSLQTKAPRNLCFAQYIFKASAIASAKSSLSFLSLLMTKA